MTCAPQLSNAALGAAMIKSEEAVIESGRRWVAGTLSDDEYFNKVSKSVARSLAGRTAQRAASALIRFLSRT
jgi:hypothetical protein